jgi:hypothetical protein
MSHYLPYFISFIFLNFWISLSMQFLFIEDRFESFSKKEITFYYFLFIILFNLVLLYLFSSYDSLYVCCFSSALSLFIISGIIWIIVLILKRIKKNESFQ